MQPAQRGLPLGLWIFLLVPVFLCGCCVWAFFAPAVPAVVGHLPLVTGGTRATATISAVTPCAGGVQLSAGEPGTNGWHYAQGSGINNNSIFVSVTYQDAQGQSRSGQTILCTDAAADLAVGSSIDIVYDNGALILRRDQGAYQQFATAVAVLAVIAVAYFSMLVVLARRRRPALAPTAPIPAYINQAGIAVDEREARLRAMSEHAVGPNPHATVEIGLKEALMLLTLRRTVEEMGDEPDANGNSTPVRSHLVLAAMMVDLMRQGRIDIVGGRPLGGNFVIVRDTSPMADPDLDALLATLQGMKGRIGLRPFFQRYMRNKNLAARLIDQLRKGGYVRLYVPQTGRFARERPMSNSPFAPLLEWFVGRYGVDLGMVQMTDDYRLALPWQFLYTTHTSAEERIFSQVQSAISNGVATDPFTQALLGLISTYYISWRSFPRKYRAAKSIYRFYPVEERRNIWQQVQRIAKTAPAPWQSVFNLARSIDDNIENPPSS